MNNQIRILHIVTYMGCGGLETMLMNYYRNIDRDKIQFDFLVHRKERAFYDDEIEQLGGRIYRLPKLNPFSYKYIKSLDKFFKTHTDYKIVHSHLNCLSTIPLKIAKKNNIKCTIAHSHTTNQQKNIKYVIKMISKRKITKYSDCLLACSYNAGRWMFNTDEFEVLNNAIDMKLYDYNAKNSKKVRRNLDVENKFVIGHVGRINITKNHKFIIKVFYEIKKLHKNSILLLVGDGELKKEIQNQVIRLGLQDSVKFLGIRNDIYNIMQAMDVFLFPSQYEGLGMSLIEAQASGLKCVVSDKIPIEGIISKNVDIISLEKDEVYWARKILKYADGYKRMNIEEDIIKSGFGINSNVKWLEKFYENKVKGEI